MERKQPQSDVIPFHAAALPDLRSISVDLSLPVQERTRSFLRTIGNPYLFRVDDVVVKVSFNPKGKPFRDALADSLNCG